MSTPTTVSTGSYILKQYYKQRELSELPKRKYPTISRMKMEMVSGDPWVVSMILSDGAGISSDFAQAQTTATGLSGAKWLVSMGELYGIVPFNSKFLKAQKDKGAFASELKKGVDAKINAVWRVLSSQFFGTGGGVLGERASVSSNTTTLTNKTDAINFWPGQRLVASANDGSDASHALRGGSPGYVDVTSVDYNEGKITTTAVSGITSYSNGDKLFLIGTFGGNTAQFGAMMIGLDRLFPSAAPTDTLYGVARTNNPVLGGFRLPSAEETGSVLTRISRLAIHGSSQHQATPNMCVLNPTKWKEVNDDMQAQGQRALEKLDSSSKGVSGYRYLEHIAPYGAVEITADPHQKPTRCHLLTPESITIGHYGESPVEFLEKDGLRMVPSTSAPGWEVRLEAYVNTACDRPWENGSCNLV